MAAEIPREIIIAFVNAVPGREAEFEEWYDGTHIPEILALPPFVAARRYRVDPETAREGAHRFFTVYEVEGSAEAALGMLYTGGLGSSDALDRESVVMRTYVPRGETLTA